MIQFHTRTYLRTKRRLQILVYLRKSESLFMTGPVPVPGSGGTAPILCRQEIDRRS